MAANSFNILVTLNSFSTVCTCCGLPTLLLSLIRSDTVIPSLGSYPPTSLLLLLELLLGLVVSEDKTKILLDARSSGILFLSGRRKADIVVVDASTIAGPDVEGNE